MVDIITYASLVDASNNMMVDAFGRDLVVQITTPVPQAARQFYVGREWQGFDRAFEPNRIKDPF